MKPPVVVVFCMPGVGHFNRLRPIISGLCDRGMDVHVMTEGVFKLGVERAGATFVDLFAKYPPDDSDAESLPRPSRWVSFAAHYAEAIVADLERLRPSLILYDTFAVIARIAGMRLGIPHVNVCSGHNVDPARFVPLLRTDPRVSTSPRCHRAVEILRERYGLHDASPFSYVTGLSPFLNVYCEPPEYLTEDERRVFEPVVFFGSLPPEAAESEPITSRSHDRSDSTLNVYVSFGTVVWRYYATEAASALQAISSAFAEMSHVRALVSLGRADIRTEWRRELPKPNVRVEDYVDQRNVLRSADVFITHHGLNSTHEAVFSEVPMISYPFFWDQPALAEKCRGFGIARPLAPSVRAPITRDAVHASLTAIRGNQPALREGLKMAREWEQAVIASRPSVFQRILELV